VVREVALSMSEALGVVLNNASKPARSNQATERATSATLKIGSDPGISQVPDMTAAGNLSDH
jgi:hypothetical protein